MSASTTTTAGASGTTDGGLIVTDAQLREVALTRAEYEEICRRLGRRPNAVELGMCGAMWSEHCGYKNSKPLLRRFRVKGLETSTRVLVGAGEENAGAVDVGDGLAAIFKIESQNQPSAVEPFEGAATGCTARRSPAWTIRRRRTGASCRSGTRSARSC
jgi:phosphoribosylformylglycinamidine synthase